MMDVAVLLMLGVFAGVLSGMLGIGGGQVLVPILLIVLASSVPPEFLMKTVLATSLATIPFTGLLATYKQNKLGNVDFSVVKRMTLGVVVGALLGGLVAPYVPAVALKLVFALFALYVGVQMLLGKQPKLNVTFSARTSSIAGAMTGAISSWVGIGGGTVLVPFLLSVGVQLKRSVGISSAVGVVVALAASVGYALSAHLQAVVLPGQWGYVHIEALMGIVAGSLLGVPLGVALCQRVNAVLIKKIFALTLLIAGVKIAASALGY